MRRICILTFIGLLIAVSNSLCFAQDTPDVKSPLNFDFVFGASAGFGGESLAEYPIIIYVEDFRPYEGLYKFKSGTNAQLFIGASVNHINIPVKFQVTLGYCMHRSTDVDDLDSKFSQYALEFFPFFFFEKFRMGAGLTYRMNPTFHEDLNDWTFRFDNSMGFFLDIGYEWANNFMVSGRMTKLNYNVAGSNAPALNANNIGFCMTISI